ncbi:MAG: glycoside hydrolase family 5 protein [Roseburia sp.]|nr:glycoside hydrolase family 5 protein [Roseburia sp.]
MKRYGKSAAALVLAAMAGIQSLSGCGSKGEEMQKETGIANIESSETRFDAESDENVLPRRETDRTAVFELLSQLNVGWNLGNTLDAFGAGNSPSDETYWGNPKTTKEMIDAVAEQGFRTIRIPVTWAEHIGAAPDYRIDEAWMDRVEEVVNYALDNDMYVILNTHHEPDFWLKPLPENSEKVKEELEAVWSQIAERFKDYDNKLMFEGMNEPRNKGSQYEWNGGTPEERVVINEWNAAFVDAVRAVGGENARRILIICTYGHSPGYSAIKELEIPEDDYIAVAVHMYTPYVFTYEAEEGNISTWDGSKKQELAATLKLIDRYLIQKGVPVLVTEFGAVNKDHTEEVVKWLADYMGLMNAFGIKCYWWDNNLYASDGENFGIFDRANLSWYAPEIADALIENARMNEN